MHVSYVQAYGPEQERSLHLLAEMLQAARVRCHLKSAPVSEQKAA